MKTNAANAAKYRNPLIFLCGAPLTPEGRTNLIGHLKNDRQAMAGLHEDYDPSLGNRASLLRKMTGDTVIALVLDRCYW